MTELTVAFHEELRKRIELAHPDFFRSMVSYLVEQLMEADITTRTGASRYQRTRMRRNQRNGYRTRRWHTRAGSITVKIPKLRSETYFPPFLQRHQRSEAALMTVIQQAYVQGVSTRKMAALAHAMGIDGLDKSTVSRICQDLDAQVAAFRARPFHDAMPYVCVDASYLNIRQNHRIVSHALLVAVGIDTHGNRHILDVGLCAGEDATSWETFLAGMVARGLHGVSLVTSDAHRGLQQAIRTVFVGSSWQRCTVHVMRNILTHIAHRDKKMVAALLKTVFVQPTIHDAQAQLTVVAQQLETRWSKPAARVLRDAEADMMTYLHYPAVHQQRIRTTNIVERLNREIKRRSKVVSVFPDQESALRLIGSVLIAEDDDWRTRRGYFTQKSMREIGVATP